MYKNSVQTFLFSMNKSPTDKMFKPLSAALYSSAFKTQTYILAYHLMNLWTCKPPEEDYHYLFVVHEGRIYHQGIIHADIYQLPANPIKLAFKTKDAMHLGKMTLFHLIMGIDFKPKDLVILQKPHSEIYYFSLQTQGFWSDFYHPEKNNIHFFSEHSAVEKIQVLIDIEKSWWTKCLSETNTRKLFLREMFEVYFRIYLTPWSVIETLAKALIGLAHPEFLNYLQQKVYAIKEKFEDFLAEEELTDWQHFLRFDGHEQLELFLKDFDDFVGWLKFIPSHVKKQAKANIIEKAMQLKILRIERFCHPDYIRLFSLPTQNRYLNYLFKLVTNQPDFFQQAHHHSWSLLNNACNAIYLYQSAINVPDTDEIRHILCKALKFNHTSIVSFLIFRNRLLAHSINQYDIDDPLHYQRSLLFSALVLKNTETVNLLQNFSITLSSEDRAALKGFLFHCVNHQLAASFSFILKHHYEILHYKDENQISFLSVLTDYCQKHQPDFINLIPVISIRPMFSFLSSSSSSDSSDMDSPLTDYNKRHANEEEEEDLPFAIKLGK